MTKIDPETMKQSLNQNETVCNPRHYGFKLGNCESFSLFVKVDIETKRVVELRTGASIVDIKAMFSFESFTKTVTTGMIYENRVSENVDLNKLVSTCIYMVEYMKYFGIYQNKSNDIGSDLIEQTGSWIGRIAAISLKKKYKENALIKVNKEGQECATFRSPLRKIRDGFVIRQLVALSIEMNDEEMMYYVGGCLNENEFKEMNMKSMNLQVRKHNQKKKYISKQ